MADGKVIIETLLDAAEFDKDFQQISAVAVAGGKLLADAFETGISGLKDFAVSSISTGMVFDSSMSQVAATMGVTTDQISDLRDFALEMGSTTAFSASQAADA